MNVLKSLRFSIFLRSYLALGLTLSIFTIAFLLTYFTLSSSAAPVPANLRVIMSTAADNAITVSWSQPSGPVSGYKLSRSGQIITINTTALNVNYVDTGLLSGQTYVYKVASSDAAGISPWSLKASGITKTGGSYTKPHSPFTDNTNMCQACHSVHLAATPYKTLYKRYANVASAYSSENSDSGQNLPGVDLCFNCHDGTGAGYNVKQYYDQPTSANVPWPGHMTRRAGTTASEASFGGWKYIQGLPAGSRLPCMVCHDSHVSTKDNWKMLADGLVDYAKSPSGGWSNGANILSDGITYGKIDTTNNQWEKCSVCHHDNSRTNGTMRVAGLDLYWPSSNNGTPGGELDVKDHGSQSNCACHAGDINSQNNVHALGKGGKPSSPVDDCSSCHVDVVNRTMSSSITSRHFIASPSGNMDPASNPDRCASKCHNNHGERTPTDSFNLYTNAISRTGKANYDFTASASQPGLCLSCHQTTLSSNRPGGTSNSTSYVSSIPPQPFIESAHSYSSTSYKTKEGKRSYAMTCLKCHRDNDQTTEFSRWGPHASANRSLLVLPATQLGGNPGDEEQTCFSCHSPSKDQWAGREMATAAWRISQAFSQRPQWGHAASLMSTTLDRHRASEGMNRVWMTSGNRHVECQDCHNPHYASQAYNYKASLPYTGSVNELETPTKGTVSGVLKGVWGVYPTSNWSAIPTAANYYSGYTSTSPTGTLFYTASAQKQAYVCLKCHSSYAYGPTNTRPNIPSGVPDATFGGSTPEAGGDLMTGQQSDILADFNPNNIGYHPIFSAGLNQPDPSLNANWAGNNGRNKNLYDNGINNPGLTTSFVPPWGASSLVTCSDCHSHSSSSYSRGYYTSAATVVNQWDFPRGPHGSARRWLLRGLDKSIRYQKNDNNWVDYSVGGTLGAYPDQATLDRNLCLNCHRGDVYWGSNPGGKVLAAAQGIARVNHVPGIDSDARQAHGGYNVWGIGCMNCHGGQTVGTIHGTGGAPQASGPNRLGRRLIYGASWNGYSLNAGSIDCYTKGANDSVNNCTQHSGGVNKTATRNYIY